MESIAGPIHGICMRLRTQIADHSLVHKLKTLTGDARKIPRAGRTDLESLPIGCVNSIPTECHLHKKGLQASGRVIDLHQQSKFLPQNPMLAAMVEQCTLLQKLKTCTTCTAMCTPIADPVKRIPSQKSLYCALGTFHLEGGVLTKHPQVAKEPPSIMTHFPFFLFSYHVL